MRKKKYCFVLAAVVLIVIICMLCGCTKKLDEPVFVKNLVCTSDMDSEISFVTNNKYGHYVTDIIIPNMPDGLHVDFYDEQIEDLKKYDVHIVNFGVGADELSASGGLKEDFVFHEVIVKWDDGSETKADIGTIHMTARDEESPIESTGSSPVVIDDEQVQYEDEYVAKSDLRITGVQIPYQEELPKAFLDMCINDAFTDDASKESPILVKKGEGFILSYIVDNSAVNGYGRIFIEGLLIGTTENGQNFQAPILIHGFQDNYKTLIEWVERYVDTV